MYENKNYNQFVLRKVSCVVYEREIKEDRNKIYILVVYINDNDHKSNIYTKKRQKGYIKEDIIYAYICSNKHFFVISDKECVRIVYCCFLLGQKRYRLVFGGFFLSFRLC